MSTVIPPTVGRVVWFEPNGSEQCLNWKCLPEQPMSAQVVYVHSDDLVNLAVLDHGGAPRAIENVPLLQGDAAAPESGWYCRWMPYQLGQAAKVPAGS